MPAAREGESSIRSDAESFWLSCGSSRSVSILSEVSPARARYFSVPWGRIGIFTIRASDDFALSAFRVILASGSQPAVTCQSKRFEPPSAIVASPGVLLFTVMPSAVNSALTFAADLR